MTERAKFYNTFVIGNMLAATELLESLKGEDSWLSQSFALNGEEKDGIGFRSAKEIGEVGLIARVEIDPKGGFKIKTTPLIERNGVTFRAKHVIFATGDMVSYVNRGNGIVSLGRMVRNEIGIWENNLQVGFAVDSNGQARLDPLQRLYRSDGLTIPNAFGIGKGFGLNSIELGSSIVASQIIQARREAILKAG